MFERYTEKARRVIFFARYEASQFGSPYIETEHMLLGFLREDKGFAMQVVPFLDAESIRQEIEKATLIREKTSTSVDLPVSNECSRAFVYAAEEADRLNHKHVGTEHLLVGLLSELNCFAARLLNKRGVTLESVRAILRENSEGLPGLGQTGARTGFGGGGSRLIRPETRVVMRRSIIFRNEADDVSLGETFSIDVPRVGDEVVLPDRRGRVTRVAYQYERSEYEIDGQKADLKPQNIVVYLQILEQ
jgi:hypothetical protein